VVYWCETLIFSSVLLLKQNMGPFPSLYKKYFENINFEIHDFFLTVHFSNTFSYINSYIFVTVVDITRISTDLKSRDS
jgi:hypothetical protein